MKTTAARPLRWGILGTAGIARKNWRAIRDSGNGIVAAVASRELGNARAFIEGCQASMPFGVAPVPMGSYGELIESPDVDAIYIPLPTGVRKEWVLRAAAAGKHVLSEKPAGITAAEVREMIDACRVRGVQFMDGVMFMHQPRLGRIREWLDDGRSIGETKRIMSIFTFRAVEGFFQDNIRIHSKLEPTGCLGDLGWYCIRFALWAMRWRLPREVSGRILSQRGNALSPGQAPTDFSGELVFDDGTSAGFYSSFLVEKQQWVEVSGTLGSLRLDDFVHPHSEVSPVVRVNGRQETVLNPTGLPQDAQMFRSFAGQAMSGEWNADWPMWALKTQQVMDACFQSARQGGASVAL